MAYRFLVVDDTSFMRKLAADCLNQFGYEVAGEAGNGREAVRLYEELRPDVVLMDLTMPELNGIDALKQILQINPEAVVLICSGGNQQDLIFEAMEAGAKGYLLKPFNPKRLQEIIMKYAAPFLTSAGLTDAPVTVAASKEENSEGGDIVKLAGRNERMKGFVSSLMCSWQEETAEGTVQYSAICTEADNKLLLEMIGDGGEKKAIVLTLEGFRNLAGWMEDHLDRSGRTHQGAN